MAEGDYSLPPQGFSSNYIPCPALFPSITPFDTAPAPEEDNNHQFSSHFPPGFPFDAGFPAEADLLSDAVPAAEEANANPTATIATIPTRDSGVDLSNSWADGKDSAFSPFFHHDSDRSQSSTITNSVSPSIFSTSQSPLFQPPRSESPRATSSDFVPQQEPTPSAIMIPQLEDPKVVHMEVENYKVRTEKQVKIGLTFDHLNYDYLRFPRQCISKPKQFANEEEKANVEGKNILEMQLKLVLATAVESPRDKHRALLRAAGLEPMPKRDPDTDVFDMDKDDPRRPENGAEVVICNSCRVREGKRFNRKKKQGPEDIEFYKHEYERVIMINEREYKQFGNAQTKKSDGKLSSAAKTIDFFLRIVCYGRHQEKVPQGYRIILTFFDPPTGKMVAQHLSDVFKVADDHKDRLKLSDDEASPSQDATASQRITQMGMPTALPRYATYPPQGIIIPNYQHQQYPQYLQENAFSGTVNYQQPSTLMGHSYPNALSLPIDTNMQGQHPAHMPVVPQQAHHMQQLSPTMINHASFQQQHNHYYGYQDTPLVSPMMQMSMESQIPRPHSLEAFFSFRPESTTQFSNAHSFASAPASGMTTPASLSRPASPTWEQGPSYKRNRNSHHRFLLGGEDEDAGQNFNGAGPGQTYYGY
ncbi:hypothetical protein CC80DRAFT_230990 [Byssothecium circinans]|uniref:SPT23/MGA2-like DNA-binding domain-containing protein n=1 Tax=Byssothecium circinans TaxID=147558 RepID=A0A6A5U8B1_9PLEO|nr:hypothetical protein CC80DRAFT_230990 [Byssothecium circinans]